jgi:hypothetical protein
MFDVQRPAQIKRVARAAAVTIRSDHRYIGDLG